MHATGPASRPHAAPAGLVLAGGLGRRMQGADKPLLQLAGRPLVAHALARLAPQVGILALSANGEPARLASLGLQVLADADDSRPGPLAGVLAGLDWAAARGHAALICVPCDAPFLPADLAARLAAAAAPSGAAVAASPDAGGRLRRHPTVALWPVACRAALRQAVAGGLRKPGLWAEILGAGVAAWDARPVDPFFNVNTPDDLARAEALVATGCGG
ncbi:MAG: molybdenum cofactor guanylyltransferase MobA [Rhodobacteraceae bacterium]|jgi:molybdopterin-guanine dinucleotide biosynthesis protein A|nr:molybdenum cofactor guanylyltransferase MobA [Paracoccaceae bacterium]